MNFSGKRRVLAAACAATLSLACSSNDGADAGPDAASVEPLFVTSTIVFNMEGQDTYVSFMPDLEPHDDELDLDQAREFPGWSGIWTHENRLFVSDGEAPLLTRYQVGADHHLDKDGQLSFLNEGAAFADSTFVAADKAYVFADDATAWDPQKLEISGSFALPEIENREQGMEYQGIRSGRGAVVRGNRAYVATGWANWDDYDVAQDSLIVVIDTDKDEVIDVLEAACPYLDVGTLDDDGNVYFSNWTYSVGPTLLAGHAQACAVRLRDGEDRIDPDWALTFADVTEGREAAALRYVGDGVGLLSVFHDERVDFEKVTEPAALADSANWQFWTVDLKTLSARPVEGVDFHAGGYALSHLDGQSYAMVPTADYSFTNVYRLSPSGSAELLWKTKGWSTELLKLR